MLIVDRHQTDPYFNLAAEEYLLRKMESDCFMVWRNEKSVIAGKHQNTLAEINVQFVNENNLPVIRRITGGGTVFHDPGNLNFSFLHTGEKEKLVDFRKYIQPVIVFLNSIGIRAGFAGKNDILVDGFKVSGNAEHVYKNKVLHHGTLLYAADLTLLEKALRVKPERFQDKAVKSIRNKVANIASFFKDPPPIELFKKNLISFVLEHFSPTEFYELTADDTREIENLAEKKYRTWDWNFGYSPDFAFQNKVEEGKMKWYTNLKISKGFITEILIEKNGAPLKNDPNLISAMNGLKYNFVDLKGYFQNNAKQFTNAGLRKKIFNKLFFDYDT